jgi:hypothetical protein
MDQGSAADAPPPFDPTLPPTSSLLFYLFADRVVPTDRRGTRSPLAGVRVDTQRLACALFAVALWSLREAGRVRLELEYGLGRTGSESRLKVSRASGADEPRRDGIEGGLLDILTPGSLGKLTPAWEAMPGWVKGLIGKVENARDTLSQLHNLPADAHAPPEAPPDTVTEAVTRWYGKSVLSPSRVPIEWTEREGLAKGYLAAEDAQRHPLLALFLGKTKLAARQDHVQALEPEFARLLARWQAFKSGENTLANQLEQDVSAGISARKESTD